MEEETTAENNATGNLHKPLVKCCYSVSLVYEKKVFDGNKQIHDIALRVMITMAINENEALGIAFKNFRGEMQGYGLTMQVILEIKDTE